MPYEDRKKLIEAVETVRGGRTLICLLNYDRGSTDPTVPGLATQLHGDHKEPLYRVLRDSLEPGTGVDLFMYTRGGDANAVWPLVSLIREFDPDFEVLVPFRCHSSGTLLALGARRIHMGPVSELSPIDPSTGNQFNPLDPATPGNRLAIGVEDVNAYRDWVLQQFELSGKAKEARDVLPSFIGKLTSEVHPLALGNVFRAHQQINRLGSELLALHERKGQDVDGAVKGLSTGFWSHLHNINRHEAAKLLGDQVQFASPELASAMDALLHSHESHFEMRTQFFLGAFMGDQVQQSVRFIGGAIESTTRSYLFETKATVYQYSKLPPNFQVQMPIGQRMPLIPGQPRAFEIQTLAQGWIHNIEPQGVTK